MLLVSQEPSALRPLWNLARAHSWKLDQASTGLEALELIQSVPTPDLVLLDLTPGDADALHTLRWLRRVRPELPVILLSYSQDAREMSEGAHLGVRACFVKPLQGEELELGVKRHLGRAPTNLDAETGGEDIEQIGEDSFFVAASPTMRKLRAQAELLAKVNVPVLILGESGSGKEIAARLIHKLSVRSGCKFLKVNCAALPGDLLESELFGYERGAFTGALRTKQGKFELCDKGTILLDEIAEMPASLQAKLLHVLQDKQFFRLGGETTIEVDVRMLAATNVDIHRALAERKLREDLYYRLSVFTIFLPPLRERQEEIPLLLRHFMGRMATQYSRPPARLSTALIKACLRYPWPGNLRELENFVKRYLVIGDEAAAMAELQAGWSKNQDSKAGPPAVIAPRFEIGAYGEARGSQSKSVLRTLKDETEVQAITRALQETQWNRKRAARLLKISYRGLLYKIRQHGITRTTGAAIQPW